jgi:hypothetical protein
MPNEQTSVPLFTAGEVLTAANMNISAGTGVPVFTNSTTRDAGFGGAGEKVLAEGQLCYLSDSNIVQYYSGASWATVGPAASGALTFINGATFTSQTAVAMANDTFTSTYQNYMVVLSFQAAVTAGAVTLRVRDNAGAKSGSDYYGGFIERRYDGTTVATSTNAATSYSLGTSDTAVGSAFYTMTVSNPQTSTSRTGLSHHQIDGNAAGGAGGFNYIVLETITGLQFLFANACTGYYKVYGLANS